MFHINLNHLISPYSYLQTNYLNRMKYKLNFEKKTKCINLKKKKRNIIYDSFNILISITRKCLWACYLAIIFLLFEKIFYLCIHKELYRNHAMVVYK